MIEEYIKEKKILKIFAVLFSILFLLITVSTIFNNKTILINFNVAIMIIGTIISYAIIYFFYKMLKKNEKILKMKIHYKIIIGIIIFILQIVIANLVYAHCGWDCGGVIDNAFSLYKGEGINTLYFAKYPNNISILILFKYIYVIVGKFQNINTQNMYWITVIFNIIMLDIAAIFTILTAKKILGNRTTYLVFLFMLPLIIFTPQMIVPYTDTITLFIPIAIYYFYLMIKSKTKNRYLYIFIEGLLLMGGYLIKPTCIIVGIAILLAEILYTNIKKENIFNIFKELCITIVILLLGVLTVVTIYTHLKEKNISKYISKEEFESKSMPATHFLMMGMQERKELNARGKNDTLYGAYSSEDCKSTLELVGKNEKIKYNIKIIRERLKKFGILGYLKFIYNKLTWTVSDGTFYYGAEGTFFITEPYNQSKVAKILNGFIDINSNKYQYITANIMQIVWIILIIGITMTYKNRGKDINILKFSIIGIILFIILFEGRSRYLYNHIPMFIIIGTLGVKNIIIKVDSKIQNKQKEGVTIF